MKPLAKVNPKNSSRMTSSCLRVTLLEDRVVPAFSADTTFNNGGRATAHFGSGDDAVQAVAVQSDGRIVQAGFAKVGNDFDFAVVRLNANGTRDTSFGTNGRVTVDVAPLGAIPTTGGNDFAYGVAIDGNGRILVSGKSYIAGSSTQDYDFAVVRLTSNGSRDTSFNGNGVRTYDFGTGDDAAFGIAPLQNGQMIVAGSARIGSDDDFAVIRLNSNGSLDSTFNSGSGRRTLDFGSGNDTPFSVFVRANGKIVLGGSARVGNDDDFAVAQLNSNGSTDTTFGGGHGKATYDFQLANDAAYSMGIFADGSIGLVGSARIGRDDDFAMVKFSANGVLDSSFGTGGRFLYDFGFGNDTAYAVTGDTSNHILLAGGARIGSDDDFGVVRLNINGTLDTTFGNNGKVTQDFELANDAAYGILVQSDGKIVVAGSASIGGDEDFAAVRFADYSLPSNQSSLDSDGDGLLDSWETNGLDINGDGVVDLNLPAMGANPNRPDIFVEIDAMVGRAPSSKALEMVRNSFSIAPVNIGGTTGIALHTMVDEVNLQLENFDQMSNNFPTGFTTVRNQRFGTAAERSSSNWANIQAARNRVFRYCIFGNTYNRGTSSGIAQNIVAQNFLVSLGGWSTPGGTVNEQAGTFMHELGHTLGLRHGGGDDVNNKPNYNSIMNYRLGYTPNATQPTYPDYSRESTVYLDWQRVVYNFNTGQGANGGLDAPRPAPIETDVAPPAPPISPVPPTNPQNPSNPQLPSGPAKDLRIGTQQFAVGSDTGGGTVRFFNQDRTERFALQPFGVFTGGIRTATADFNRDGIADIVAGTGPGGATQVVVLDGKTQAKLFELAPFEATFVGGVYVAAGDITGDGIPDFVVTPDEGGGPRARVYSGAGYTLIADFFGIEDPNFRGGARATIGDINGDGKGELIIAAGFGGGPRISIWDGASLVDGKFTTKPIPDFFAFEPALRNGSFASLGDITGDGNADLIFGGGPGGGPRVRIFDGVLLRNAGSFENVDQVADKAQIANFFAGNEAMRGGVRLAIKDLDNDGLADLITGAGSGDGNRVAAFLGRKVRGGEVEFEYEALPGSLSGVFVG